MAAPPSQNEWQQMLERAYRAEDERNELRAEVERLRSALRQISRWDMINPPYPGLLADAVWLRKLVDDALASPSEGVDRPGAHREPYVCRHCSLRATANALGGYCSNGALHDWMPVPPSPSEAQPATICARCGALWSDKVNTACDGWLLPHDWMPSPSSGDSGQDKP
jgi:hypothetical protein